MEEEVAKLRMRTWMIIGKNLTGGMEDIYGPKMSDDLCNFMILAALPVSNPLLEYGK